MLSRFAVGVYEFTLQRSFPQFLRITSLMWGASHTRIIMSPETALIRLHEREFEFIDHSIKEGYYADRDDFIRDAVKLLISDVSKRKLDGVKRYMNEI